MEHPTSEGALRRIPGIGQVKVERYGSALLDVVRRHASQTSARDTQ
jgi:superfamily II DNA helicase RecQ